MPDLFDRRAVPLLDQIACVKREIAQRARVYPRLIEAGRMTAQKADQEKRAMAAVLETLEGLLDRESRR